MSTFTSVMPHVTKGQKYTKILKVFILNKAKGDKFIRCSQIEQEELKKNFIPIKGYNGLNCWAPGGVQERERTHPHTTQNKYIKRGTKETRQLGASSKPVQPAHTEPPRSKHVGQRCNTAGKKTLNPPMAAKGGQGGMNRLCI